tara:strand:- start:331 stop:729 length:399 start_codon:yes stop_codon:yes gene_type:complete
MSLFFHGLESISIHCPKLGRRFTAAIRIIQDSFDARECSNDTATALLDEAGFDDMFTSVGSSSSHNPVIEKELEDLATGNATRLFQNTFPTLQESYVTAPHPSKNSLEDDWVAVQPYEEQLYALGHDTYRLF